MTPLVSVRSERVGIVRFVGRGSQMFGMKPHLIRAEPIKTRGGGFMRLILLMRIRVQHAAERSDAGPRRCQGRRRDGLMRLDDATIEGGITVCS